MAKGYDFYTGLTRDDFLNYNEEGQVVVFSEDDWIRVAEGRAPEGFNTAKWERFCDEVMSGLSARFHDYVYNKFEEENGEEYALEAADMAEASADENDEKIRSSIRELVKTEDKFDVVSTQDYLIEEYWDELVDPVLEQLACENEDYCRARIGEIYGDPQGIYLLTGVSGHGRKAEAALIDLDDMDNCGYEDRYWVSVREAAYFLKNDIISYDDYKEKLEEWIEAHPECDVFDYGDDALTFGKAEWKEEPSHSKPCTLSYKFYEPKEDDYEGYCLKSGDCIYIPDHIVEPNELYTRQDCIDTINACCGSVIAAGSYWGNNDPCDYEYVKDSGFSSDDAVDFLLEEYASQIKENNLTYNGITFDDWFEPGGNCRGSMRSHALMHLHGGSMLFGEFTWNRADGEGIQIGVDRIVDPKYVYERPLTLFGENFSPEEKKQLMEDLEEAVKVVEERYKKLHPEKCVKKEEQSRKPAGRGI